MEDFVGHLIMEGDLVVYRRVSGTSSRLTKAVVLQTRPTQQRGVHVQFMEYGKKVTAWVDPKNLVWYETPNA